MVGQALNPHQQYLKTRIETATQPQLLLMLFDASVKKLHLSKKAIENKEIEKAHTELTKVQRIFTELMLALDMEKGGDLAGNLMRLYDFVYHHLVKANIRQDVAMIDEVLPIVESLREGWTEAVQQYESPEQEGEKPQGQPMPTMPRFDSNGIPSVPKTNNVDRATFSKPANGDSQPRPAASKPKPQPAKPEPSKDETPQERPRLNLRG